MDNDRTSKEYVLRLTLGATLADAVRGLRSVDDAGDELLMALETAARVVMLPPSVGVPVPRQLTDAEVAFVVGRNGGNIAAAARELRVARSTVRTRLARLARTRADNDTTAPGGARRTG